MTPEELNRHTPALLGWIEQLLRTSAAQAQSVQSRGFRRLPGYFHPDLLASIRYVIVDRIPVPPLTQMGLSQFNSWENGDYYGVTYRDTFFVKHNRDTEDLFLHELVHVIQWRELGPDGFVAAYADGLERFAYETCPLEVMAFQAQAKFLNSLATFDVETIVRARLKGATTGVDF